MAPCRFYQIANPEQNKKLKVVKTGDKDKNKMGMFYLNNTESSAMDIFPQDLAGKICVDLVNKGWECTREVCTFIHPRNPRDMDKNSVIAIGLKFCNDEERLAERLPLPRGEEPASRRPGNDGRLAGAHQKVRMILIIYKNSLALINPTLPSP